MRCIFGHRWVEIRRFGTRRNYRYYLVTNLIRRCQRCGHAEVVWDTVPTEAEVAEWVAAAFNEKQAVS